MIFCSSTVTIDDKSFDISAHPNVSYYDQFVLVILIVRSLDCKGFHVPSDDDLAQTLNDTAHSSICYDGISHEESIVAGCYLVTESIRFSGVVLTLPLHIQYRRVERVLPHSNSTRNGK